MAEAKPPAMEPGRLAQHAFVPRIVYENGARVGVARPRECGVIVEGWTWTVMDPITCGRPPEEHER